VQRGPPAPARTARRRASARSPRPRRLPLVDASSRTSSQDTGTSAAARRRSAFHAAPPGSRARSPARHDRRSTSCCPRRGQARASRRQDPQRVPVPDQADVLPARAPGRTRSAPALARATCSSVSPSRCRPRPTSRARLARLLGVRPSSGRSPTRPGRLDLALSPASSAVRPARDSGDAAPARTAVAAAASAAASASPSA
jgi:hypothetical protein